MMRKIRSGLAALGAFVLFALALWAGGDAKLVVARDASGIDAGRLMSQIATPFSAAPARRFGDGVPRGSFDDEPKRNEDVTRGSHADGGA